MSGFSNRLLPGIPPIESPLFELYLAETNFSPAERELAIKLNSDGYAIIDFPDDELDERIDRIRGRLPSLFGAGGSNFDGVICYDERIQDAWISDPDVKAIACNPTVIAMLSKFYGRTAFPFQTLNFNVGTQQALHTDAVHFSSIPQRFMCGVWIALEDVDPNSGPLCYVPGSHKWPIMNNALIGRLGYGKQLASAQSPFQDVWSAIISVTGAEVEEFTPRKGQALIWCANLLHGGSPRRDYALSRWSQVTHYYFEDCVYYTPAFSDEYLGDLQLRQPVSATDGLPRRNSYVGQEVLPVSDTPKPNHNLPQRLRQWLKSASRRNGT